MSAGDIALPEVLMPLKMLSLTTVANPLANPAMAPSLKAPPNSDHSCGFDVFRCANLNQLA
jgi:hypothetical protein